jgi:hypothetical protein
MTQAQYAARIGSLRAKAAAATSLQAEKVFRARADRLERALRATLDSSLPAA